MRISDWSSDVCSSDLVRFVEHAQWASPAHRNRSVPAGAAFVIASLIRFAHRLARETRALGAVEFAMTAPFLILLYVGGFQLMDAISAYRKVTVTTRSLRSEEHTSELQSLMRISYAAFCLQKKTIIQ